MHKTAELIFGIMAIIAFLLMLCSVLGYLVMVIAEAIRARREARRFERDVSTVPDEDEWEDISQ